jgi:hypothetical protein
MSPWWRQHMSYPRPCELRQRVDVLHDGLCKHCRREIVAEGVEVQAPSEVERAPHDPELEPLHDRPWIHRGGG